MRILTLGSGVIGVTAKDIGILQQREVPCELLERARYTADACLVALGSYSPLVLRPIGIRLPVYPVKGCPITVPIDDASHAPESTIMDETHKVAVTRLGDRIRVGGTGHGTLGWTMAARAGALKQRLNSPDDFQACSPRVVQDTNAQGARGGDCAGGQSAAG